MQNRRFLVATLASILLTATACEQGTTHPPAGQNVNSQPNPSNPAVSSQKNNGTFTPPKTLSIKEAWKDVKVTTFDAILPDGRAWGPLAIGEAGEIVGGVPVQKPVTKAYELILYNTKTGNHESIATLGKDSQAIWASLNDRWIVWSESLDQTFVNWKMHAYDRINKKDSIVATSASEKNGRGFDGPIWMPSLYGDEFVWSPSEGPIDEKGMQVVVKKYNLKTGELTELAKRAGNPVLTQNFALWIGRDDETNDGALFWNKGNRIQQLTKGKTVGYVASDGESIVWSGLQNSQRWELWMITPNGEHRQLLAKEPENAIEFLSIGSRVIALRTYDKIQVYDRKLDSIVILQDEDAAYSQPIANNHYLIWNTPIPKTEEERKQAKQNGIYPSRIHLIDLNSLP
ncbi:hypothetical protein [Effusibacillus pohliae]|uniref:hypothetical protein n=1 Tax=Effusibacillus pohliae TaxID=232270 RepID=UPI000365B9FF|nr:hypothetical protein [Effusibacillus pohliae]